MGAPRDVYWTLQLRPDRRARTAFAGGVGGCWMLCTETTSQVATTQALRDKEACNAARARRRLSLGVWGDAGCSLMAPRTDKAGSRALFDIADDIRPSETRMSRIHPEDIERVRARRERLQARRDQGPEYRVRTANWRALRVHTRARLMPDPQRATTSPGVAEDVKPSPWVARRPETSRRLAVETMSGMTRCSSRAGHLHPAQPRAPLRVRQRRLRARVRARPLQGLTVREAFPSCRGRATTNFSIGSIAMASGT